MSDQHSTEPQMTAAAREANEFHARLVSERAGTMIAREARITNLTRENARLRDMLDTCIRELRCLGAHTVPTQAENLLAQLGDPASRT